MGKLLKYEIKKDYKFYLGMYIIILLINVAAWIFGGRRGDAVIAAVSLTSIAAYITTFISVLRSYWDDLHEGTGYLLFTLPRSGNEILGSKLIVGVMWLIITTVATIVLSSICAIIRNGIPTMPKLNIGWDVIGKLIGYGGISIILMLFMTAYLILMIYFSITISKVTLHNKKGGGVFGFMIFILLSILLAFVTSMLIRVFPQCINFGIDSGIHSGDFFSINFDGVGMNIAASLFTIISFVGLFMSTGWLMENKIDM